MSVFLSGQAGGSQSSDAAENRLRFKAFTSPGAFTIPPGVSAVEIYGCAAGVGSLAGEYVIGERHAVAPGQTINVTVGPGDTVLSGAIQKTLAAGAVTESLNHTLFGIRLGRGSVDYTGAAGAFGFAGGNGGACGGLTTYYGGSPGKGGINGVNSYTANFNAVADNGGVGGAERPVESDRGGNGGNGGAGYILSLATQIRYENDTHNLQKLLPLLNTPSCGGGGAGGSGGAGRNYHTSYGGNGGAGGAGGSNAIAAGGSGGAGGKGAQGGSNTAAYGGGGGGGGGGAAGGYGAGGGKGGYQHSAATASDGRYGASGADGGGSPGMMLFVYAVD